MRIIAIGLGGAGCRIVDQLYATDRRSSKVACVQGLAIDIDEPTLKDLKGLPEKGRIFFPALDVSLAGDSSLNQTPTATIDIGEVVSRVQNIETGEIDAILLCIGLGGSMADIAPHIITALRSSVVEPIFGLVTLPCLAEGERRSSKAADDIDILQPLLDGLILFDNETWYKKIKAEKAHLLTKEKGFAEKMGLVKGQPELSTTQATYALLNDGIVKRISLILRAGEFKADGGIDLAEVVLDSGEVLNTMKGMGFITIGYAVERLPSDPFSFLSRLKPAGHLDEDQKKKASRLIDLAKQAIYHEISTPCDMTSAHKALILIAGPSHELSMMGFMTVRKWIDRSIAGLETRSGDYPVMNTKNVAIIIMLSGLENIPRVTELREIRDQYRTHRGIGGSVRVDKISLPGMPGTRGKAREALPSYTGKGSVQRGMQDEMIRLPEKQQVDHSVRNEITGAQTPGITAPEIIPEGERIEPADDEPVVEKTMTSSDAAVKPQLNQIGEKTIVEETAPRHAHEHGATRVPDSNPHPDKTRIVTSTGPDDAGNRHPPTTPHLPFRMTSIKKDGSVSHPGIPETGGRSKIKTSEVPGRLRETDRQKIEQDLQRQRVRAITGHLTPAAPDHAKHRVVGPKPHSTEHPAENNLQERESPEVTLGSPDIPGEHQKKVILVSKKKAVPLEPVELPDKSGPLDTLSKSADNDHEEVSRGKKEREEHTISLREPFRADDKVLEGKKMRRVVHHTTVNDAGLIHTALKSRRVREIPDEKVHDERDKDEETTPEESKKNLKKKTGNHDDVSWI